MQGRSDANPLPCPVSHTPSDSQVTRDNVFGVQGLFRVQGVDLMQAHSTCPVTHTLSDSQVTRATMLGCRGYSGCRG